MLQTYSTHAKISTHTTHAFIFDPHQNFMDPHSPHHPRTHAPTLPTPPRLFSRLRNSPPTWGGYFYSFKQVNFSFLGGGRGGVSAPLHAMDVFSILFSDFNSTPALPANILPCFSCWTIFVLLFFLTPQNFHGFGHLLLKNKVSIIRSRARLTDLTFRFFWHFCVWL